MEQSVIDPQVLAFLRIRDTAKTWTSGSADPTSQAKTHDAFLAIQEAFDNKPSLAPSKFQFRTLLFQQSFQAFSMASQPHPLKLGLSCLYFVLESTHNWTGMADLQEAIEASEFQGYFQSQEHQLRLLLIAASAGNCLQASSPYEFIPVVLNPGVRKAVRTTIDLSLSIVESCELTAEEIFLGSCILVAKLKLQSEISDWMTLHFEGSLWNALQLKEKLLPYFESDSDSQA